MKTLGMRLKNLLKINGLNHLEFSKKTGLTTAAISQIINDKRDPGLGSILKICKGLNLTPNDLLGFTSKKDQELLEKCFIQELKLKNISENFVK